MTSTRLFVLAIALLTVPVFSFCQTSVHTPAGAIRGITFNSERPLVYGPLAHPPSFASFVLVSLAADNGNNNNNGTNDKEKKPKKKHLHGDEMSQRIAILVGISAMLGYVLLSYRRSRQRV